MNITPDESTFERGTQDPWTPVESGPVDAASWNDLSAIILAMETRLKPGTTLQPSSQIAAPCDPSGYQLGAAGQAWRKIVFSSSESKSINLIDYQLNPGSEHFFSVTFGTPPGYTIYPYDIRATVRGRYTADVYTDSIVFSTGTVTCRYRLSFPKGVYGTYIYRVDAMAFLIPVAD